MNYHVISVNEKVVFIWYSDFPSCVSRRRKYSFGIDRICYRVIPFRKEFGNYDCTTMNQVNQKERMKPSKNTLIGLKLFFVLAALGERGVAEYIERQFQLTIDAYDYTGNSRTSNAPYSRW